MYLGKAACRSIFPQLAYQYTDKYRVYHAIWNIQRSSEEHIISAYLPT